MLDSVEVNARWAPITSLLSRLTSAPVWVRVKNASDSRWTWPKTDAAQVEDQALADARGQVARGQGQQRVEDRDDGHGGRPATTTSSVSPAPMPSSTMRWISSGRTTTRAASTTVTARKMPMSRRCGRANAAPAGRSRGAAGCPRRSGRCACAATPAPCRAPSPSTHHLSSTRPACNAGYGRVTTVTTLARRPYSSPDARAPRSYAVGSRQASATSSA